MKIVSLNLWGGKIYEPLVSFLKTHQDIDVFCFQEVFHAEGTGLKPTDFIFDDDAVPELYTELTKILPDHVGYFSPVHGTGFGIAFFVKKDIRVEEFGEKVIYENKDYDPNSDTNDHSRKLQWLKLGDNTVVINVHGHWTGQGKSDTPARLQQSEIILSVLEQFKDSKRILCGDFNLRPDTESIRMLEQSMRNLIVEYNITSTRTNLYKREEKYADFMFVSPDVTVQDFTVLPDEVSDHAPLYLQTK